MADTHEKLAVSIADDIAEKHEQPDSQIIGKTQDVSERVRGCIYDSLKVDRDEITQEATLVGDLGAESIDFLDIVFRLEKEFEIELSRTELFPEDVLTSTGYVQDGIVTEAGIEELKKRMPFADLSKFEENPAVQLFGDLLTVSDLSRYVESKVGQTMEK